MKPHITGVVMLAAAFTLAALGQHWLSIIMLAIVGGYDIWLGKTEYGTITKWVHKLLPRQLDMVVICVTVGLIWWAWGEIAFLNVTIGIILGHLFWNE